MLDGEKKKIKKLATDTHGQNRTNTDDFIVVTSQEIVAIFTATRIRPRHLARSLRLLEPAENAEKDTDTFLFA